MKNLKQKRLFNTIKENKYFYVFIVLFIGLRAFYLNVGYYWDEAWVYVPALRSMSETIPSLLPDAIPEFYSRAHPLLYHFIGGIWLKVFGTSFTSYHLFALIITVFYLGASYFTLKEWSNAIIAMSAVILLSFNRIFFAEATTVQPEVLLGMFTILSLRYFIRDQIGIYLLFSILLVLTKETGVLLPFTVCLYYFINEVFIHKERNYLQFTKRLLTLSIPLFVFLLFLGVTYLYKGWFLNPEHTGMVTWKLSFALDKFKDLTNILIDFDNNYWITGIVVLSLLINKNRKYDTYIAVVGTILSVYLFLYQSKTSKVIEVFGLVLLIFSLYHIYRLQVKDELTFKSNEILVLVLFLIIYMLFTVINFYTGRYHFSFYPLIYFFPVIVIYRSFKDYGYWYYLVIAFLLFKIVPINYDHNIPQSFVNEIDYGQIRIEVTNDLEKANVYNEKIGVQDFVLMRILQDHSIGYLKSDKSFTQVSFELQDCKYAVITNYDTYPQILKSGEFKLVKKYQKGIDWVEWWERLPNDSNLTQIKH